MASRKTFLSVDAYVDAADPTVRPILLQLRKAVTAAVPGATECISYQMPALRHQRVFFYFAAFKKHLSYLPHSGAVIPQFRDELADYGGTDGSLHFTPDHPLPRDLVGRLVQAKLDLIHPA